MVNVMFTDRLSQTRIVANIKLGHVQAAIERLVKEHSISMIEWNRRAKRVEKVLGDLLRRRDDLIKKAN